MPSPQAGIAPWRMWSNSPIVTIDNLNAPQIWNSPQISQIDYGRPDTWTFLFAAKVFSTTLLPGNTAGSNVPVATRVIFDLSLGHARSSIDITNFCTIDFAAGSTLPMRPVIVTSVEHPPNEATRISPNLIEYFPAESIRCSARLSAVAGTSCRLQIQVAALFAPRTHVRPEWFSENFRGGEDQGS